ncbi:MAG: TetR family transcriptional regulator [Streptosporangiales bacterium]|nr:TetR family transcriptional regulator [Streptosporangiales bacterium]
MGATAIPEPVRRGRPRSERAHRAILRAAAELLAERGLRGMSAGDIAARAKVSKATIYRWWDSKEAVALDAFLAELSGEEAPVPDTGSLAGDLKASLRTRIRLLARRPVIGRTQAALVAETQTDPRLREAYLAHVMRPLRQQGRDMFAKAVDRGEVPADTEVDLALDLIYGALYHRLFQGHAPLDDHFAVAAVDLIVRGLRRP